MIRLSILGLLQLVALLMMGQGGYDNLIISEFLAHSEGTKLNPDWVELYNGNSDTLDVGGCYWSDDRQNLQMRKIVLDHEKDTKIPPNGFLVFRLVGKETSAPLDIDLKLDKKHGWIGFTDPTGRIIDSLSYGPQGFNISAGRIDLIDKSVFYFHQPSLGTFNRFDYNKKLLEKPIFSEKGGFYKDAQFIELSSPDNAQILYTTDGSTPAIDNPNVQIYKQPIYLERTAVIRAVCRKDTYLTTSVRSHTYFINEEHTFPVISLSVDAWNEYQNGEDDETDKEIKAYIEFYDTNGIEAFDEFVGLSLAGGGSRRHPQKSISIHTRAEYGSKWLDYRFFEHKPFERMRGFVLRNAGNSVPKVQFKDAFMQEVIGKETDLDYLASRPTIVYINGSYNGIYNLREKKCKHYFEDNHSVDGDNIDYLNSFYLHEKRGSKDEFKSILDTYNSEVIADSLQSDRFVNRIDLDHFLDYQIAEIFYANTDWPINNVRIWKSDEKDAKWRWLMFDIDLAYRKTKVDLNSVEYALGVNNFHGESFSERLVGATSILRGLTTHRPDILNQFVNRFADLLNTTFSSEHLLEETERFKQLYAPEMERHVERWNIEGENVKIASIERWERGLENMRDFARERQVNIRKFLQEQWEIGPTYELIVNSNLPEAGQLTINSIVTDKAEWQGVYFANNEIQLSAKAFKGHKFLGWEYGDKKSKSNTLSIKPNSAEDYVIRAIYK